MPDTETFESDHEDDDFQDEDEGGFVPPPAPRRRNKRDELPDAPVENAGDIPLLAHAGTGKANTVTYLKITRLDGVRGVRGVKGKLPPESTFEDVARRYGNGTYKVEGCNYKHRILAREEGIEISIPGFDEDPSSPAPVVPQGGVSGSFGLHGMQMIAKMGDRHGEVVRDQATSMSEQVQAMAAKTMEMITAFTTAQRESERASHESATQNQQQFFATMMAMTTTAHAQQMEMLTAMHDRQRNDTIDPMVMVKMFMDGLKTGGELGGNGDAVEPWVMALKEGTGALGHLAQIATSPVVRNLPSGQTAPSLPPPPPTRALPGAANGAEPKTGRKRRLPFKKDEIRGMARLKATLRQRGISLTDFLEQTREHVDSAPDSDLFEDDGPGESEEHAAPESSPEDATT